MQTNRLLLTVILFLLALLQVSGSGRREDHEKTEKSEAVNLNTGGHLKVVASTNILGDVVSNIGGDDIALSTLIEAGQDPHGFEPTPSTYALIENAEVIFVNGFGLEESLLEDIEATAKVPIISVSDGIEPIYAEDDEADHQPHTPADPHVWLDPANVLIWADNIEKQLISADPSNSDGYRFRAEAYRRQLKNLDTWIRRQVALIPKGKRKLITDHHTFGYFAKEYGFEIIGTILPGLSTGTDASPRSIANLIELLQVEGLSVLFVGTTAGRSLEQLAKTIASELKREVQVLRTLTGSLSASGEPGDTYIGYMEYNTGQIAKGLSR